MVHFVLIYLFCFSNAYKYKGDATKFYFFSVRILVVKSSSISGCLWISGCYTLLAHVELICDPPTQILTLVDWDRILVSHWDVLVHLHSLWYFEALGGAPGKHHRLVTLGGCRLLDGSGVVSVELSVKIVEEPRGWLWGVRAHLTKAAKATLVKSRYWVSSCPLGSKIKLCLGRGASESLNSTSTWIRGDRQITDTTG
jgi:hypothetical protein